ncbi:MAG: glycosyltransferase family 2 protein [Verrucomicrobiales bacterium]|nr:glycosyltransferase family 2 protein [Verrucomicrobiales bacterium]
MHCPEISIILPTRNRRETIERTVEHVIGQTFQDWELVISDNASDEEGKIPFLKKLAESDSRIKLHLQPTNIGLHANWRFCIAQSIGRYHIAVTDDDWWGGPGFLEGLLSMHDGTTGVVFPNLCIHYIDTGEVLPDALSEVYRGVSGVYGMSEALVRDGRGIVMIGLVNFGVVPKDELVAVIDNDFVSNIETIGMNRIARKYPMVFCEEFSYHHTAYSGNYCRSFEGAQIQRDRGIVAFQLLAELRLATSIDEKFRSALEAQWEVVEKYCREVAFRDRRGDDAGRSVGDSREKVRALRDEIKHLRSCNSTFSGAVRSWLKARNSRVKK